MRIRSVELTSFKRFHNLIIRNLPSTAKLVVLTGPNGIGKSSLFDAFRIWQGGFGIGISGDRDYFQKEGLPEISDWGQYAKIEFHDELPTTGEQKGKVFYFRTSYRNEADFTVASLSKREAISTTVNRFIDNDTTVKDNYHRLVSSSVKAIYSGDFDDQTVKQFREEFIGQVRKSMKNVFDDLDLSSLGDPLERGTFFFDKGSSNGFHYKNLSAGEKAAFDLLLDMVVKRSVYSNAVYCIDEPEMHMHTKLQARLLRELLALLPKNCQLWIASHSIGMMREAWDQHATNPRDVVFLDFQDRNFDEPVILESAKVDRGFWAKSLEVALGDLAKLIAPKRIVLCEGRPVSGVDKARAELDATCYRTIFGDEFPDTDFVSVGNATAVATDQLVVGETIQTLVPGTILTRLIDRDDRSVQEIMDLQSAGVRVLSKRHLEAYLMDDEILTRLCEQVGLPQRVPEVLAAKSQAMADSVARGNAPDDVKSASGSIYVQAKKILGLTAGGNTVNAFLRDTSAPLVTQGTKIYIELKKDIFKD